MGVDQAGVVALFNSNAFVGRAGQTPRWIILHGTAGGTSAQSLATYFRNTQGTGNPVSSHYVIGTDGTIVQAISERDGAYGNGVISAGHDSWWVPDINPNNVTISIEHCKPSIDNSDSLTAAQQDASFRLIDGICTRWNIPRRAADASGGITGHYSIDPISRKNCPGPYPWDALWAYLKGNDPVIQAQLAKLRAAYDIVVAEKNMLAENKTSMMATLSTIQSQLAVVTKKLTTLEAAYDIVVAKKNALVSSNELQVLQIAQLQATITTLRAGKTPTG